MNGEPHTRHGRVEVSSVRRLHVSDGVTNQKSMCLFPNSSGKIAHQKRCQHQVQISDLNAVIDRYPVKRMNESLRELFRPTASAGGEFGIKYNASFFSISRVYYMAKTEGSASNRNNCSISKTRNSAVDNICGCDSPASSNWRIT